MQKIIFTTLSFLFILSFTKAQFISGKVTYENTGMPVIGASVSIKGTNNGAITDIEGNYRLKIDSTHQTVIFAYIECQYQEIEIKDSIINVVLEYRPIELNPLDITAYIIPEKRKIRTHITEPNKKTKDIYFETIIDSLKIIEIKKDWPDINIETNWAKHIYENINYPDSAIYMNIVGTVYAQFKVTSEGDIIEVKILRNLYPEIDKIVLKTLESMPNWDLSYIKQRHPLEIETYYPMKYILPIRFRLEEK
jgi:hypothetical protein